MFCASFMQFCNNYFHVFMLIIWHPITVKLPNRIRLTFDVPLEVPHQQLCQWTTMLLFLLILATSVWNLSKLWGGGIPTLDTEYYSHRLCRLPLHFNLALPPHLFILPFLDRSFTPSFLPPPHPQIFIFESLSFHLLPTYSPGTKRRPPWRCLQPPPASLHHSYLRPALRACVYRRSPCRCASLFAAFGLHSGQWITI